MSLMLTILKINDIFIPCLSIFTNILLLWLIKTVETKTLKHIKFVIIPNILIDIVLAVFFFVVAPHIFDVDGNVYIVFGSVFNIFGFYGAWILFPLFASLCLVSINSISVSFYLRYLIVCKNRIITSSDIVFPYFLLLMLYGVFYVLFFWCYPLINEAENKFNPTSMVQFWYNYYGRNPVYVAGKLRSIPLMVTCVVLLASQSCSYSLIFYYSRKITQMLQTHSSNFLNTKIIHKQIHFALIVQAIAPSMISTVGFLLFVIETYSEMQNYDVSLCLSLFYTWTLITNPIAAILIIKPYRFRVKNMFLTLFAILRCKKPSATYSISATTKQNSTTLPKLNSGWIQ